MSQMYLLVVFVLLVTPLQAAHHPRHPRHDDEHTLVSDRAHEAQAEHQGHHRHHAIAAEARTQLRHAHRESTRSRSAHQERKTRKARLVRSRKHHRHHKQHGHHRTKVSHHRDHNEVSVSEVDRYYMRHFRQMFNLSASVHTKGDMTTEELDAYNHMIFQMHNSAAPGPNPNPPAQPSVKRALQRTKGFSGKLPSSSDSASSASSSSSAAASPTSSIAGEAGTLKRQVVDPCSKPDAGFKVKDKNGKEIKVEGDNSRVARVGNCFCAFFDIFKAIPRIVWRVLKWVAGQIANLAKRVWKKAQTAWNAAGFKGTMTCTRNEEKCTGSMTVNGQKADVTHVTPALSATEQDKFDDKTSVALVKTGMAANSLGSAIQELSKDIPLAAVGSVISGVTMINSFCDFAKDVSKFLRSPKGTTGRDGRAVCKLMFSGTALVVSIMWTALSVAALASTFGAGIIALPIASVAWNVAKGAFDSATTSAASDANHPCARIKTVSQRPAPEVASLLGERGTVAATSYEGTAGETGA